MRVTAVRKGYFGGKIRDAGEVFDLPDALMRDGRSPSWVLVEERTALPQPTDRDAGSPPRKRRKPTVAEAPEPPESNGLQEALGGPPPDWLPGTIDE